MTAELEARELGANVGNTVYRTGAWIAVRPAKGVQLASQASPAIELDPWLAWMREPRSVD